MKPSCAVIRLAPDRVLSAAPNAAGFVEAVGAGLPANACRAGEIRAQVRSHGVFDRRLARWAVNEKSRRLAGFSLRLVPRRGLEPPRLAALVPETSASTNSAIWAGRRIIANDFASGKRELRFMRNEQAPHASQVVASQAAVGAAEAANACGASGCVTRSLHEKFAAPTATAPSVGAAPHVAAFHLAEAARLHSCARRGQQKSRSEERLSCETGAQKRTRTSTPRSAST